MKISVIIRYREDKIHIKNINGLTIESKFYKKKE